MLPQRREPLPIEPPHELLTPSLTAADDLLGTERPWVPDVVWALTVIAGPIGGGALLAWNDRRLGIRGRWPWILVVMVSVALVAESLLLLARSRGWIPPGRSDASRALTFVGHLLAALVAGCFVVRQRRRFQLFVMSPGTGEPARLLGWALLAILLNVVVILGLEHVTGELSRGKQLTRRSGPAVVVPR
jgi:hypothetical protein